MIGALLAPLVLAATVSAGSSTASLDGRVMVGYQGWFACEGDGSALGWRHWSVNPHQSPSAKNIQFDFWPDVSEFPASSRYVTGLKLADGRPAELYTSANAAVVDRHFEWMREHGIDGVFLQRYPCELAEPALRQQRDAVLGFVRASASRTGRSFAVMYDLTGLKAGEVGRVGDDWLALQAKLGLDCDGAYQREAGRPLVAIWGVGFADDRAYALSECRDLVVRLKSEGCAIMLGVPSWWREGKRDALADPMLREIAMLADVISPWSVGRYRTPDGAVAHAETVWRGDAAWCREHSIRLLPVVFPGFSWHNLHGGPLDEIPRLGGKFLWSQFVGARRVGATSAYVAMFDEVNEGTAIFKCAAEVPMGNGLQFLSREKVPSDHYLRVTGLGGKLLRGENADESFPLALPLVR